MKYPTLGHRLPSLLAVPLYGDRERFGLVVNEKDECWQKWQTECVPFYEATQRKSVGARVSDAGYRVMEWVDLTGKKVLEIGPGEINHLPYWKNRPAKYVVADIRQEMLEKATKRLQAMEIDHECVMLNREDQGELPFADGAFDVILTFYSLEHLYPFQPYLDGMLRVLKPGGANRGSYPGRGRPWVGFRALSDQPALFKEKYADKSGQNNLLGAPYVRGRNTVPSRQLHATTSPWILAVSSA